jgi:hypothetical protein
MRQQQSYYEDLRNKWATQQAELEKKVWDTHAEAMRWAQEAHEKSKYVAAGSLAGLVMMSHPGSVLAQTPNLEPSLPTPVPTIDKEADQLQKLLTGLAATLPETVEPLDDAQNAAVGALLSDSFHLTAVAELEGNRLNRTYGIIGAEQHLMRYPGDTIATHFDSDEERKYISSGMAPGRGAWGYFAPSRLDMTEEIKQREKYYIAVQTFLAPGWGERTKELYQFFKFRKMLVVNPENGKGIVAVIGDAGPGVSTKKHLGGSPEVMAYLERQDGRAKGPVLYFFIDDPENTVPLGPIKTL